MLYLNLKNEKMLSNKFLNQLIFFVKFIIFVADAAKMVRPGAGAPKSVASLKHCVVNDYLGTLSAQSTTIRI